MHPRNPLSIARRARGAINDTIERHLHHRRLMHFTRQGIEPELINAGAAVLAWELSAQELEEAPEDRRGHLLSVARQVYRAVVPEMRATYGLCSPGDLPEVSEVLERFGTQAARQVPSTLPADEKGHHEQSMDVRERTRVAEVLLRHTLAEILIHPDHLKEDLS